MTITTIIASRVKELRGAARLSGADVAAVMQEQGIGWNRTTVAKLETGRRESVTVQELLALAVVLNVPPVWLLADPASPHPVHVADGVDLNPWSALMWLSGHQRLPQDISTPPSTAWMDVEQLLTAVTDLTLLVRVFQEPRRGLSASVDIDAYRRESQEKQLLFAVERNLLLIRSRHLPLPPLPPVVAARARELGFKLAGAEG